MKTTRHHFVGQGLLTAGLSMILSSTGIAQDREGSQDHPLISRYPGSEIVEYSQKQFDEYNMHIGPCHDDREAAAGYKCNDQHLEGKIAIFLYKFPKDRGGLEVFRNYQQSMRKAGFEELFQCFDEACGRDNDGESHIYDFGRLNNRYLAAKRSRDKGDVYAAVNVVDQAHTISLVVVELKPMESGMVTVDAAVLGADIGRSGHAAIYGIYFDTGKADVKPESADALKEIAKLLQRDSKLKLLVVGHTDNVGGVEQNMDLSLRRAHSIVKALMSKYNIPRARLRAIGDGPSAPVASNDDETGRAKNRRVELVKQ